MITKNERKLLKSCFNYDSLDLFKEFIRKRDNCKGNILEYDNFTANAQQTLKRTNFLMKVIIIENQEKKTSFDTVNILETKESPYHYLNQFRRSMMKRNIIYDVNLIFQPFSMNKFFLIDFICDLLEKPEIDNGNRMMKIEKSHRIYLLPFLYASEVITNIASENQSFVALNERSPYVILIKDLLKNIRLKKSPLFYGDRKDYQKLYEKFERMEVGGYDESEYNTYNKSYVQTLEADQFASVKARHQVNEKFKQVWDDEVREEDKKDFFVLEGEVL